MQHITLKQARIRRQISISKLAREAGVDRSTVMRIENGEVRPLHQTVVALQRVLGIKFTVAA